MLKVNFHNLNTVDDKLLKYAVMVTRSEGRWLFVRHKDRTTWEIPGGHREEHESIDEAAKRELQEETGAMKFTLKPICIYSVNDGHETFGQLYCAEVEERMATLESEIAEVALFDEVPEHLTYPLIMPELIKKIEAYWRENSLFF